MAAEYIAIAQDRLGKIEDIAVCNALDLARRYADQFAMSAPHSAVIRIFIAEPIEVQSGRKE